MEAAPDLCYDIPSTPGAERPEVSDGQGQLSPREREVAALIARGMTNAEIALSLGLSASTVKHYVETAMRKAGVTNRVALAMWLRDQEGAG